MCETSLNVKWAVAVVVVRQDQGYVAIEVAASLAVCSVLLCSTVRVFIYIPHTKTLRCVYVAHVRVPTIKCVSASNDTKLDSIDLYLFPLCVYVCGSPATDCANQSFFFCSNFDKSFFS